MNRITPVVALATLFVAIGCGESPTGPAQSEVGPAFDDIPNNLDATVDADAEVMALTLGGANGTTMLRVIPTNGDGKNGCNLTGSTTLVVNVVSSNASVATASPSSITFGSCGDEPSVTVTPVGVGSATISLSQVSNSTAGSFNLAPATFTVEVTSPAPSDATPPSITPNVSGTLGNNGWYVSDVTVTWSVVDAESSITSTTGCGPTTINTDTNGTTLTCSATSAGGTASQSVTIKRDATVPTASASASPAANGNGWNNSDVTVSFSGSDALSGIASCSADVVLSAEGAGQSASGTCTDNAGNVSATATASGINIDKTAPTVAFVGGPADGGSYYFGSVPAAPTCSASDALSGIDGSCTVAGYGTAVGSYTIVTSATDKAGNTSTDSHSYTVLAWTLDGFFAPVNMGAINTAKSGSTVPLKFEIFAGAYGENEQVATTAVKSFVVQPLNCSDVNDVGTEEAIDQYSTGGTVLRYDSLSGQFIQNWQTPKYSAGKCFRVTMTALDGSMLTASFKLK